MFPLMTILILFVWSDSPETEGLRIARLVDEANNGFNGEYAEMEMVLINAHGDETVRKLITETAEMKKDGDRSISTFQWPADVKGTRMLTWSHKTGDDDQWLYLPALKRVKRISSRNKSGAFMGSEFSYEDLGSQEVEEYTYKYLGEESVDGRDSWKVARFPVSRKSGYTREVVWFDKEYMNPLRIEYYDRKDDLLKVALFTDYKKYDRWWRADSIRMENVQTKKISVLTWKKRELGKDYSVDHFSSDYLVD
jgi:hypothetical protein